MGRKSREKLQRVIRECVAVVTTSYPEWPGDPSGHFVHAEVRALEAGGADVEVFALRGAAFGWPGVAARVKKNPTRLFGAACEIARVAKAIETKRPFSRLIAHWALPSAWPILRKFEQVEVVSHGGDVRLLIALPRPLRNRLAIELMQNARIWRFASRTLLDDLAVTLSDKPRALLLRIAQVSAPTIDMIVDHKAIALARAEQRKLAGDRTTFVVAARLVRSKNVDRAITYVADENGTLVVIGDGPDRARLERFARDHRANAHFLGVLSRPETLAQIAAADALLHASTTEGLSSVVREADALGTRVIRIRDGEDQPPPLR